MSCSSPCYGKDNSWCCDTFWLPRMEISNNIFYSQDNYVDGEMGTKRDEMGIPALHYLVQ